MAAIKRMHVAVNCSDLQKSLGFLPRFFGAEPTKVKDNYAKFELDSPCSSLLFECAAVSRNMVFLIIWDSRWTTPKRSCHGRTFEASGLLLIDEMNTTCCYAVQDKVWVYDPDGNAWEIFYTKEDSEFESAGGPKDLSLCCAPPSAPVPIHLTSFKKTIL